MGPGGCRGGGERAQIAAKSNQKYEFQTAAVPPKWWLTVCLFLDYPDAPRSCGYRVDRMGGFGGSRKWARNREEALEVREQIEKSRRKRPQEREEVREPRTTIL